MGEWGGRAPAQFCRAARFGDSPEPTTAGPQKPSLTPAPYQHCGSGQSKAMREKVPSTLKRALMPEGTPLPTAEGILRCHGSQGRSRILRHHPVGAGFLPGWVPYRPTEPPILHSSGTVTLGGRGGGRGVAPQQQPLLQADAWCVKSSLQGPDISSSELMAGQHRLPPAPVTPRSWVQWRCCRAELPAVTVSLPLAGVAPCQPAEQPQWRGDAGPRAS